MFGGWKDSEASWRTACVPAETLNECFGGLSLYEEEQQQQNSDPVIHPPLSDVANAPKFTFAADWKDIRPFDRSQFGSANPFEKSSIEIENVLLVELRGHFVLDAKVIGIICEYAETAHKFSQHESVSFIKLPGTQPTVESKFGDSSVARSFAVHFSRLSGPSFPSSASTFSWSSSPTTSSFPPPISTSSTTEHQPTTSFWSSATSTSLSPFQGFGSFNLSQNDTLTPFRYPTSASHPHRSSNSGYESKGSMVLPTPSSFQPSFVDFSPVVDSEDPGIGRGPNERCVRHTKAPLPSCVDCFPFR